MQFSKWHALGNSYLVVEQPDAGPLTPARVQRLCSVATGIGSDGVLEVTNRDGAHAVVTIWNPDG
jgi:diaminopimelate epimerase